MDNVLIDTDVILDFFFDRKPFSDHATKLLSLCESKVIVAYVTPVIISNVYYVLKRTAKHEYVIEKLTQLLLVVDILDMNFEVVKNALNSGFKDFEDAMQNFAAVKHGKIDVILTRNVKDFKKSEIGIMTPENYIKSRNANLFRW